MRLLPVLLLLLTPALAAGQGSFGLGHGAYNTSGYSSAFPGASVPGATGAAVEVSRGNTIFSGLTLLHDPIEQVDLHLLYQQSIQLAQQSAAYADQANQRANQVVAAHQAAAAQLSGLRARSQAASVLMSAVSQAGESALTGASPYTSTRAQPPAGPAPTLPGLSAQAVADGRCVRCHNSADRKGGLDLTNFASLAPPQVDAVRERITAADPGQRMPPDGQLSPDEISALTGAAHP
jgi:hypothetical protein